MTISPPAGTLTFSRNSMCGSPARTVGWRDPGFIHTSFLKGLWPNTKYHYKGRQSMMGLMNIATTNQIYYKIEATIHDYFGRGYV